MRPWRPRGLEDVALLEPSPARRGELWYIVVEELSEGVASLVVSPWPEVDGHGRLRFPDEDEQFRVVARRAELRDALREYRVPVSDSRISDLVERELRERPLAVGDVFGAWLWWLPGEDGEEVDELFTWLSHPVLDVTAAARDAAKAQTSAAVAPPLVPEEVERLADEFREDEPPQPQGPTDPAGGGAPQGGAPAGGLERAPDGPWQRLRTWRPGGLSSSPIAPESWDALWYLVVDEIQEGIAVLVVSPWPRLDDRGRLRFAGEDEQIRVALPVSELRERLAEQRVPVVPIEIGEEDERALRERPLAVGDAFAADLAFVPDTDGVHVADAGRWLVGPLLDISAEVREVAKAQTNAAIAGALSEGEVALIEAEAAEDDESPPEPSGGGSPGGEGGGGTPLQPSGRGGGAPETAKPEENDPQLESATQRPLEA